MKNLVVAIEGVDSVGKETQAKLLAAWANGFYRSHIFSFPNYETPTGKIIRSYLNGQFGQAVDIDPYLASMLYASDRAAMRQTFDAILVNNKQLLIMDRYVHSNAAFQGAKISNMQDKLTFFKSMEEVEFGHLRLPKPDIVIFLDAPPATAKLLMEKRKGTDGKTQQKDQHESNDTLLENAYQSYLLLAADRPDWHRVECIRDGELRSAENIHSEIQAVISSLLFN